VTRAVSEPHNGASAFIARHRSPRFGGAFFTTVLSVQLEEPHGDREREREREAASGRALKGSPTTMTDSAAISPDHHHRRHPTSSSVTKSSLSFAGAACGIL